MTSIDSVVLGAPDPASAEAFYATAFDLGSRLTVRASDAPTSGFRGYTLSIVVPRPSTVDSFVGSARDAGADVLKPAAKSFWGYGGAVRAPDGAVWTIASSSKKDTGPADRAIDDVVLLLGVADVKASRQFYVERGLAVAKSFGSKYVEFDLPESPIKLALYGRRAAARNAGVSPEGTGSARIVIVGDAGPVTDPDGFEWEPAATRTGGAPDR
jgi:predicted lactoylglutathione lyase